MGPARTHPDNVMHQSAIALHCTEANGTLHERHPSSTATCTSWRKEYVRVLGDWRPYCPPCAKVHGTWAIGSACIFVVVTLYR